ncbi:MAG: hypothetical protein IKS47_01465 [Bacteroidales bacterium]|nr:hypothetical protein [Bacteroidales bacterium]
MRLKLVIVALAAGLLLSACGPTGQILYNWGGESNGVTKYERLTYRTSAKQSPESICAMLVLYEQMVKRPGGLRQVPPPGICAEYAWLLAQPETAAAFAEHATARQKSDLGFATSSFMERSRDLFEMEMRYYPESVVFIKPLAERLFK